MRTAIVIAALLFCAFRASELDGQSPTRSSRFEQDSASTTSPAGIAFVASAVLPGAGQKYLGSDRWVPFIAIESWAWIKYLDNRSRGRDLENQYRDLAWNVARRLTTSARRDSVFTYYEALGAHDRSGQFDADPAAPGLQPESDPGSFNGIQWIRAQALFLRGAQPVPGTPEYELALAYYRTNAIPDTYSWSWGNNRLEQEQFRETISRSDAAFRDATSMMGVILANHIVSAVDALVQARVKMLNERRIRIGSNIAPDGSTIFWTTTVQIPLHGADRVRNPGTDR